MSSVQEMAHRILRAGFIFAILISVFGNSIEVLGGNRELRRDDLDKRRPAIKDEKVEIDLQTESPAFPRYLNELGIKKILIRFQEKEFAPKKISFVWTGGSQGTDRFSVRVDGIKGGVSRMVHSQQRPHGWYRDEFWVRLGAGREHVLEITSPPDYTSDIEFAGIRIADEKEDPYRPLCYESIGTHQRYEKHLGAKGAVIKTDSLWIFTPYEYRQDAERLSMFLQQAYRQMKHVYGIDPLFTFSIALYPQGHKRGWGGISGMGTLGYTVESLQRFTRYGKRDVRGFAGFTEEMSHGFKSYYRCDGTYEALGLAVQEDIIRRLVSPKVADQYWLPERAQWEKTYRAYMDAGKKNPDPKKYPWNVLYTRILNHLFRTLQAEYGEDMWRDFFRVVRQMDFPLHRAAGTERMKVYADIFSVLFGRDMRKEFVNFGIDLDGDPPWGWQTYKK